MGRSLARRSDGCYECCKRRLKCDKAEPECLKCQKKGISCSGQGLRCRFSSFMTVAAEPGKPKIDARRTLESKISKPEIKEARRHNGTATGVPTAPTVAPSATIHKPTALEVHSSNQPATAQSLEHPTDASSFPDSPQLEWIDRNGNDGANSSNFGTIDIADDLVETASGTEIDEPSSMPEIQSHMAAENYALESSALPDAYSLMAGKNMLTTPAGHTELSVFYAAQDFGWPSLFGQSFESLPIASQMLAPVPAISENVSAQARALLSHFCDFVAPMMVVFDFAGNGYRDIILPLALQDEVLRKAVTVVATFHLSQKAPGLQASAMNGHRAIIEKLRIDALRLRPEEILTPYTWATILVLLVGETITGANNYIHLLEMLKCLKLSSSASQNVPAAARDFFLQQMKMFELFGLPLADEAKGLQVLEDDVDQYMEFMACDSLPYGSAHRRNMEIMREAVQEACSIYRLRAFSDPQKHDSRLSVELLRQTVLPLDAHIAGSHALVWTYFVAAADSELPEHREFFSKRLRDIYEVTAFGSIPKALESLEVIWAMHGVKRWTEVVSQDLPVLVM